MKNPCKNHDPHRHKKKTLHVICVVSNPVRFKSRYKLFHKFNQFASKACNVKLHVVEQAFGHRPFEITQGKNPNHLQLRSFDEIWHKENMINLAIARLPHDWEYVAWVDADVAFLRNDWAFETIEQLQHYMVVQMFDSAIDLGPNGESLTLHKGFMWAYRQGRQIKTGYNNYHPGFAWAARREAIDFLGGLIDKAILGSGDHHMARCLVGTGLAAVHKDMHPNYKDMIAAWEHRALRHIRLDVGYVPGTLVHSWHGKKKDRRYADRWNILIKHGYDPYRDIKRDWQGLYTLEDERIELRDDIRNYFRARCEDSIDLE